jgi:hypothetical protein
LKFILAEKKSSIYLGVIYALVSIFLIAYVPTLTPGGSAVGSYSYIFGYNNRVGLGLILVLTAIAVLLFGRLVQRPAKANDSASVSPGLLWACLAVALLAGFAMYLFTSRLGSYNESTYFINRIEMASHGLRPYRDFEFGYGACFVYVPLFLSRLFHLSIPNSYYVFWTLNLFFGTWFLAEVVSRLDYPGRHRNAIFLMLFLATLTSVFFLGLNYTAFRFASAPLLAIVAFKVIRDGQLRSQIYGSFLVPVFMALLILISPEIGISYGLGMSAFMAAFYFPFRRRSSILPCLGMLLLIVLLLAAANQLHLFDTMKGVAGGGLNFPIIPSPSILIFLFCIFICAALAASSFWDGSYRANYICVFLIALPMLSPAFSRCDPWHIFWNGFGIFCISLLWASGNIRGWKYYGLAFSIVFIFLSGLSATLQVKGDLMRVCLTVTRADMDSRLGRILTRIMVRRLGADAADAKLSKYKAYKAIAQIDASSDPVVLPPQLHGTAEVPFGYGLTHNTASLDYGFYEGLALIADPHQVDRKISELKRAPDRELILPRGYDSACSADPNAMRALVRILFIYPYRARVVRAGTLFGPLCDYISSHYVLAVPAQPDTYDYEIWAPK